MSCLRNFYAYIRRSIKEYNLDFYYTNTDEWNARSVRADLYSTLKKYMRELQLYL